MAYLALDPQQSVTIDFSAFTFPPAELVTRTSGEDLLMLVWAGERKFLLFDRDIPREDTERAAAIRAEVDAFNDNPLAGWEALLHRAHVEQMRAVNAEIQNSHSRMASAKRASREAALAVREARAGQVTACSRGC